ncbi:hypothetical protein DOT_1221 [Desulfosporosinus sp. OT]|nr:hypothetical protein DOT_1221 [Desulfosporosinus sp. OT]
MPVCPGRHDRMLLGAVGVVCRFIANKVQVLGHKVSEGMKMTFSSEI